MFLEYDWCFDCYRPRFGSTFIDVRGDRSFASMADAKYMLALAGLGVGRKVDSRSWEIVTVEVR